MYVGLERVRPSLLRRGRCSEIFKGWYVDTEGKRVPECSKAETERAIHETVARHGVRIPSASIR